MPKKNAYLMTEFEKGAESAVFSLYTNGNSFRLMVAINSVTKLLKKAFKNTVFQENIEDVKASKKGSDN